MTKAEGAAQQNLNRRREIVQEKKEAKMEKDEAKRYQTLKDELVRLISKHACLISLIL